VTLAEIGMSYQPLGTFFPFPVLYGQKYIVTREQTTMDNEQILPALLAQDLDRYFWKLAVAYQDQLYAFALHLTGSVQDAEDIVQEALLGAYVTLSHYPSGRTRALQLRPWLYKLMLNVFYNHKRKRRLLAIPLDLSEDNRVRDLPDLDGDDPERFFENVESQQEMAQLVLALPEQYRLVITCYYFEELSYQEIAELLDQPLGTVKSRLHRGLKMLKQTMQSLNQSRSTSYGRY
jgi:RNA polymerase sigma-70 factor (ECF subfamily)